MPKMQISQIIVNKVRQIKIVALFHLGPIEQRFSGSSRAHLSPCSDADPGAVFMWMNNIFYRVHPDIEQLWPEYSEMLRGVCNSF